MMKKIINVGLILTFLAFTLIGVNGNPASAHSGNGDFGEQLQSFGKNAVELKNDKSEKIFKNTKEKIKQNNLVIHGDLKNVKKYKVYRFKDTKQKLVNIVFNNESGKFHTYNVTLKNGSIVNYGETILTKVNETEGHIKSYIDGELKADQDYNVPNNDAQTFGVLSWWGAFNDCMSNQMQVPGWVITGISVSCSIICAGTAGTGCIPCVYAAAGAYSFDVGYCVGYANDHS